MKRLITVLLFGSIASGVTCLATETAAAGRGADDFIRTVGLQAIDSLTGEKLSDEQRQARFRTILNRKFEIPLIARFTLGRFWRRTSETQRKEYVGLFENFIAMAYATLFRGYSGETFKVGTVREVNKTDSLVQSEIGLKDGRKIAVYWRVRGKNDFKIIDVIVENVSMVITQRDQFAAIINQNGGTVDGLLSALRKKTAK